MIFPQFNGSHLQTQRALRGQRSKSISSQSGLSGGVRGGELGRAFTPQSVLLSRVKAAHGLTVTSEEVVDIFIISSV